MELKWAVPEFGETWTLFNGSASFASADALALEISRMILFTLPCVYVLDYLKYSSQILIIRDTSTAALLGFAFLHFVNMPIDESLLSFGSEKVFTTKLLRGSKTHVKMAVMSAFGTSSNSTNSLGHRVITFMNSVALCGESKGLVIQALAALQTYYATSGFVDFPMDILKERGLVPMLFLLPQFSQEDIEMMNDGPQKRSESPKPVCTLLGDKELLSREIINLSMHIGSIISFKWDFNSRPPMICQAYSESILAQDRVTVFVATLFACKKELDAAQILKIIEARVKLEPTEVSKLWRFYLRRSKNLSIPYCSLLESYHKRDAPIISTSSKLFKFLNEK